MNNIDFDRYKENLRDYLFHAGIDLPNQENPLIKCFNPNHSDSTPSCQIFHDSFKCYACGIHGDIYDAVRIIENINEPFEQYKHIQEIFGGEIEPVQVKKHEPKENKLIFPDEEKQKEFEKYLASITNESVIRQFFETRARFSSHEKLNSYPQNIIKNLIPHFFYWNGLNEARRNGISEDLLKAVNVPLEKEGKHYSSWSKAGIILKLGIGYKLHYYSFLQEKQKWHCEKRGTEHCKTFPTPSKPLPKSIVLVEGELDAIVCQSAGIENAFSTGGTQGLTKQLIEYFINGKVESITFCYDNDEAGKQATIDKSEFLRKCGYTGEIKHAKVSELHEYKDPDEAILWNHLDFVKNAIENASIYHENSINTHEKKNLKTELTEKPNKELLSKRAITTILSHIKINNLTETEQKDLAQALINISNIDDTKTKLTKWGLSNIPNQTQSTDNQIIITLAKKCQIPRSTIYRIENALNITNNISGEYLDNKLIAKIDISGIKETKDFQNLINAKNPIKEAANILEYFLEEQLIYTEDTKRFYFFDGLVWNFRSDITDIAYYIMRECVNQYYDQKEHLVNAVFARLGGYDFCRKVMQSLAEKPSIFREHINFDSDLIKETLTLQDCVLDFSGKTLKFREAEPQEYRYSKLPYTRKELENEAEPKNFLKFMNSNFDNKDTLTSLLYYLSTIPSRSVTFKVGGIFTGITGTGKTTTIELLSKVYPGMIVPIPRSFIMQSRYGNDDSGANPFLCELEGKGAGVSDETEKNDKLNSSEFKKLTSNGQRTARQLYSKPHTFNQTAQTIICTNYAPLFDSTDAAVVDRLFIIQFSKQHKKGEKGTLEFEDLMKSIEQEKAQIVRFFALKYIELKTTFKSKIPDSEECKAYKADYIEKMDNHGLQGFVSKYLVFAKGSGKFVLLKDLYHRYCRYWNIELDQNGKPTDPDKLTQNKFTAYLKRDYNEFSPKQKRINGYPEQVVMDLTVKEWNEVPEDNITTETTQTQQTPKAPITPEQAAQIEEENPFADATPATDWNKK